MSPELLQEMNRQFLLNGINMLRGVKGFVSVVHTDEDIDVTIDAFGKVLDAIRVESMPDL